jgi:hypothetical protein
MLENAKVRSWNEAMDLLGKLHRTDPIVPSGHDQRGRHNPTEFRPKIEMPQEPIGSEGAIERVW